MTASRSSVSETPGTALSETRIAEIRAQLKGITTANWYPDETCDDDEIVVRFEPDYEDDDAPKGNPGRVVALIPIFAEDDEERALHDARFIASSAGTIGELLSVLESERASRRGEIARLTKEREEAAASSRALSEEEREDLGEAIERYADAKSCHDRESNHLMEYWRQGQEDAARIALDKARASVAAAIDRLTGAPK